MFSGEELVEQHAEGVDVGGRGDGAPFELLWRGVFRGQRPGAGDRAAQRDAGGLVDERRDPEVEQFRPSGPIDEDIRGLEIAVHDEARVGIGDRVGDLEKELEPGAHGKSMRVGEAIDAQAVDELQDEERLPGRRHAGVVETRDAGVGEARQDRAFAAEALRSALLDERRVKELDGDIAFETSVVPACPPDRSHAAGTDALDELVGAERPTLERNCCR